MRPQHAIGPLHGRSRSLTPSTGLAGALRSALTDPARRERNVLLVLAAYVLLWTLYGTIAKGSQGLHYDMTE